MEIGTERTRLLFDAGEELPPLDDPDAVDDIELEGLTYGEAAFDGVFISHYHNDHCGLIRRLLPGIPVFAGDETRRVLDIVADFTDRPRPEIGFRFSDGGTIRLGDVDVTPLAVPHSARGAYMFLVRADGKNVLYTGDFREAPDVPDRVRELIGPDGRLDALITEGTNIRREPRGDGPYRGEDWVTRRAAGRMRLYPGTVFVLCSSTNFDRIDAMERAAGWTGRTACGDLFLAAVRGEAKQSDGTAARRCFTASFVDRERTPRIWPYFQRLYSERAIVGAESLAREPGPKMIFVRASMLPFMKSYLAARREKGDLLIYSQWSGYKEHGRTGELLDFCRERDIAVEEIHVSGHAYRETLEALIRGLSPEALVPIHCGAADRGEFLTLHDNCLMLPDGERREL